MALPDGTLPFSGGAMMGGDGSPVSRDDIFNLRMTRGSSTTAVYNPLQSPDTEVDINETEKFDITQPGIYTQILQSVADGRTPVVTAGSSGRVLLYYYTSMDQQGGTVTFTCGHDGVLELLVLHDDGSFEIVSTALTAALPLVIDDGVISNGGKSLHVGGTHAWSEGEGEDSNSTTQVSAASTTNHVFVYDASLFLVSDFVKLGGAVRLVAAVDYGNNELVLSAAVNVAEGDNVDILGGSYGRASHTEGIVSKAGGDADHAEGYHTRAMGYYGHAEGCETRAYGTACHAEGNKTISNGYYAHAEGDGGYVYLNVIANCYMSTAISVDSVDYDKVYAGAMVRTPGNEPVKIIDVDYTNYVIYVEDAVTVASGSAIRVEYGSYGSASHTEGYGTTSSGTGSHAEGTNTLASSTGSHAEGRSTKSTGNSSHSEGNLSVASGIDSHAEGNCTISTAYGSHSEGVRTFSTNYGSHSEGYGAVEDTYDTVNDPSSGTERYEVVLDSVYGIAEGDLVSFDYYEYTNKGTWYVVTYVDLDMNTIEIDGYTSVENGASVYVARGAATGYGAHSEGVECNASGYASHAGGYGSSASGRYSFAHGAGCKASGDYSIVLGKNCEAVDNENVVLGSSARSRGYGCVVIGNYAECRYNSYDSVAIGHNAFTRFSVSYALALGYYAGASGYYSTAIGSNANSFGFESLAMSRGKAFGEDSVAIGTSGSAESVVYVVTPNNNDNVIQVDDTSGILVGDTVTFDTIVGVYKVTAVTTGFLTLDRNVRVYDDESVYIWRKGALGDNSLHIGKDNRAAGDFSACIGEGLVAEAPYGTAVGKFNYDNIAKFVVGDGTDDNTRTDCFKVDGSGRLWFMHNGNLTDLSALLNTHNIT